MEEIHACRFSMHKTIGGACAVLVFVRAQAAKKSHRLSTSRPKKVRLFRNGDGNFDVRTTVIQELFFVKFHEPLRKRRVVRNAKQFV